jgi:hypothetical protein
MNLKFLCVLAVLVGGPALSQSVDWGDDSGEWARDGECDDRRFHGPGMATSLDWLNAGLDATDCKRQFDRGNISIWTWEEATAATLCSTIDFGNDSSEFANDGTCDDVRFEGRGTDGVMRSDEIGADATDCRRLCGYGVVLLRNY